MPVEIDVPNPEFLLRPGMGIHAYAVFRKVLGSAVAFPASSVVGQKDSLYVYVVRNGKAHKTPVCVSFVSKDEMQIESGVRASDRIVVDPRGPEGEIVPIEVKKAP